MSREQTARILCVDDDKVLLETLSDYLTEILNVSVKTASSVPEALKLIEVDEPYDVIVSDFQIPPENGNGFHRALRAKGNRALFVLYSGYGGVKVEEFSDDRFLGHMEKPDLRKLAELVRKGLASLGKK